LLSFIVGMYLALGSDEDGDPYFSVYRISVHLNTALIRLTYVDVLRIPLIILLEYFFGPLPCFPVQLVLLCVLLVD
jgi:hypothetical protein